MSRSVGSGGSDAAAGQFFAGGIRGEEKTDAPGPFFGRDGVGGAVGAVGGTAAAAVPEGGAGPAADRAGSDAADLFFAAVVWAGRRGAGGCAVRQPGAAQLCRYRPEPRPGARRDDSAALPPLAGAARSDPGIVRRGRGDAGGARL